MKTLRVLLFLLTALVIVRANSAGTPIGGEVVFDNTATGGHCVQVSSTIASGFHDSGTAGCATAQPLATGSSTGNTLTAPFGYFVCTSTCTVTPPIPAAGYQFCVMNADNVGTVITIGNPGTSTQFENTARTAYGTPSSGTLVSGGAKADMVCIVGLDSTHYLTTTYNGIWTAS
jgi:hypothetical protein